ncbi:diguanylate cyclase [Anaerobacillus sp. CMMVII]|uniref:sensor domain-containing diguanylate cyclase n=1 Tax=Anaerobacillus sp. CMMVII TaxID=2755588 RepID=UPI0021B74AA4|nr:diguanylate cyclase [Anaerobacillus sp. CMMVII]
MESEQKYKSLFEYNTSLTYTIDKAGRFINVNKGAAEITGYSMKELEGSRFLPLISEGYANYTMEQFNKALNGESVNYETQIVRKDGKLIFLNVNVNPIVINGQTVGVIGIAHDITQQKEAEENLLQSEKRYRSLIELSPEVIFVHSKSKIEYVNDKAISFIGVKEKEDIVGKTILDFIYHQDKSTVATSMSTLFTKSSESPEFYELQFIKKDGTVVVGNVGIKIIEYQGVPAILGIIHDITKQKELELNLRKANEMLMEISHLDGLTGIPNRRYYEATFARYWNEAIREEKAISLIMIDIDCFKLYNDRYGHQQGDECLKQVALTLKSTINRQSDFVARYGGEEFSVILSGTDEEGAILVAERLRKTIERLTIPHQASTVSTVVTISLGVATDIPIKETCYQDLINKADQALYLAKENGRNRVVEFKKKVTL